MNELHRRWNKSEEGWRWWNLEVWKSDGKMRLQNLQSDGFSLLCEKEKIWRRNMIFSLWLVPPPLGLVPRAFYAAPSQTFFFLAFNFVSFLLGPCIVMFLSIWEHCAVPFHFLFCDVFLLFDLHIFSCIWQLLFKSIHISIQISKSTPSAVLFLTSWPFPSVILKLYYHTQKHECDFFFSWELILL